MSDTRATPRPIAVPSGRVARLARLGGLASGIAGNVLASGAREMVQGRRPPLRDLVLTPANAARLADQLAQMRGAAMKVGQLMSMDAGDMLPPELAEILGRLRAEAHYMPPRQLKTVLGAAWGSNWLTHFERFDVRPIAAASIGQVHRARTRDGRDLAIKVQYPGVRRSIDSDVDNVAALMRVSGVLPRALDLAPMLAEAKRQLHDEADYLAEGAHLRRFAGLLGADDGFSVPGLHDDLTTQSVLAMDFVAGQPIEALESAPQAQRDAVIARLLGLMFRELFAFRLMQTDPNFANYRHDPANGRVILLDFGATRALPEALAEGYRGLMAAGLAGDAQGVQASARALGFWGEEIAPHHLAALVEMIEMALAPLRTPGLFDFGDSDVAVRLRDAGMNLGAARDFWHVPPMETLFVQRKFGGIYLLAARLRARVDLRALITPHLADPSV